jgi:hypothetical protein
MGSRISEIEKLTFLGLHKSGMSINEISRRTGRSTDSVKQFVTDDVAESAFDQRSILTNEDMHKIFDLYSAGKRVTDISRQVNQPISTVGMVTRRLYPKHQKAYAKWLELQNQEEAPVTPVVPPALQAIRDARDAGRTITKQEEESPALVMEVQTVEAQRQDEPEQPSIDWQAKWCEAQQQIAELREINSILKGYVRHLQRLNEQ